MKDIYTIDDMFGGRPKILSVETPEPKLEIPDWFRRLVPPDAPSDGYNQAFFDQTKGFVDTVNSMPEDEWDEKWLRHMQTMKVTTVSMSQAEIDELTEGTSRLRGLYTLEIKFLNMANRFWPVYFGRDGEALFIRAMMMPMFQGKGGWLICRYAVRSVDTGERWIPFKTGAPPSMSQANAP